MNRNESHILVAIYGNVATGGIATCCAFNLCKLRFSIVSGKYAVDIVAVNDLVRTVEVYGIAIGRKRNL